MKPYFFILFLSLSCAPHEKFSSTTPRAQNAGAKPTVITQSKSSSIIQSSSISVFQESSQESQKTEYAPQNDIIQKGSFTVWTVPEDPKPRESYRIFIEVSIPEKLSFSYEDIDGMMIGTDGYQKSFGGKEKEYLQAQSSDEIFSRLNIFKSINTTWTKKNENLFLYHNQNHQIAFYRGTKNALYSIDIPGAPKLVKDTITVYWENQNERQEIEIIF